jgi:hypothetical protein
MTVIIIDYYNYFGFKGGHEHSEGMVTIKKAQHCFE